MPLIKYDIVHTEEEVISLNFNNPMEVLYHLKQTGVTGTCNQSWTRSKLNLFCQEYERLFSPDKGSVSLTYHPIGLLKFSEMTSSSVCTMSYSAESEAVSSSLER